MICYHTANPERSMCYLYPKVGGWPLHSTLLSFERAHLWNSLLLMASMNVWLNQGLTILLSIEGFPWYALRENYERHILYRAEYSHGALLSAMRFGTAFPLATLFPCLHYLSASFTSAISYHGSMHARSHVGAGCYGYWQSAVFWVSWSPTWRCFCSS